jgi:hypothetical protein
MVQPSLLKMFCLIVDFFDPHFDRQGMSEVSYVHMMQLRGAHNVKNALSFAWEGTNPNFYKEIKEKVTVAEVLVIIGYSFLSSIGKWIGK